MTKRMTLSLILDTSEMKNYNLLWYIRYDQYSRPYLWHYMKNDNNIINNDTDIHHTN